MVESHHSQCGFGSCFDKQNTKEGILQQWLTFGEQQFLSGASKFLKGLGATQVSGAHLLGSRWKPTLNAFILCVKQDPGGGAAQALGTMLIASVLTE